MQRKDTVTRLGWTATIAAVSILYLFGLNEPGLNDGEAMFAQIPREMLLRGDWITPRLNGTPHFDKPPLIYWLIAITQTVIGKSEFTARLWPALCVIAAVPVVAAIGRYLYSSRAGWFSGVIFASSLGIFLFGRLAMTDSIVVLLVCLSIFCYVKGCMETHDLRAAWVCLLFACLGLGALTKGLVGAALPAGVIMVHAVLSGAWKKMLSWPILIGPIVALAVAGPWYVAAETANPGFLDYFFLREHLQRFTGQRYPADEFVPLHLFLLFTFMWTFPWATVLPAAVSRTARRLFRSGWRTSPDLLPVVWTVFILTVFGFSRSRLEYYSLPAVPALALLLGNWWNDFASPDKCEAIARGARRSLVVSTWLVAAAALAALAILGPFQDLVFRTFSAYWPTVGWEPGAEQISILERMRVPAIAAFSSCALAIGCAAWAAGNHRPKAAFSFLAALTVPLFALVHWGFEAVEPFHSTRPVARIVQQHSNPVDVLAYQEPYEYMWIGGITYYTERMVHVLKDPRFENAPAKRREPPERFLDEKDFLQLWHSEQRVVAVVESGSHWKDLLESSNRGTVVGSLGGRIVAVNENDVQEKEESRP